MVYCYFWWPIFLELRLILKCFFKHGHIDCVIKNINLIFYTFKIIMFYMETFRIFHEKLMYWQLDTSLASLGDFAPHWRVLLLIWLPCLLLSRLHCVQRYTAAEWGSGPTCDRAVRQESPVCGGAGWGLPWYPRGEWDCRFMYLEICIKLAYITLVSKCQI